MIMRIVWWLYCAETSTRGLWKQDIRKLKDFIMWIWSRMEKISWREKLTNEEKFKRVGKCGIISNCIFRRKRNWFEHVM